MNPMRLGSLKTVHSASSERDPSLGDAKMTRRGMSLMLRKPCREGENPSDKFIELINSNQPRKPISGENSAALKLKTTKTNCENLISGKMQWKETMMKDRGNLDIVRMKTSKSH
jgi:hypothetical protein